MNRNEYRHAVDEILTQVHALHSTIGLTLGALGSEMARTAEWNVLYEAMRLAGVMSDRLNAEMHPRPSALVDDDAALAAAVDETCAGGC